MTTEQKAKAYDEALEWMRKIYPTLTGANKEDAEHYFPELKESEDEKTRKKIIRILQVGGFMSLEEKNKAFAWLEKQKEQTDFQAKVEQRMEYLWDKLPDIRKVVEGNCTPEELKTLGAYTELEMNFDKSSEEKQKEQKPTEWSEEDREMRMKILKYLSTRCNVNEYEEVENWLNSLRPQPKVILKEKDAWCCSVAWACVRDSEVYTEEEKECIKKFLYRCNPVSQPQSVIYQAVKHDLAIKFINYLDENRPEGKMCLSNGECEDIDKAFKENDWAKIMRYVWKYQIQPEKKPEVKLTGWVARDMDGEICVYENYPERIPTQQFWFGLESRILEQKSFPDLKWEDEPVEVELTIRKKQ